MKLTKSLCPFTECPDLPDEFKNNSNIKICFTAHLISLRLVDKIMFNITKDTFKELSLFGLSLMRARNWRSIYVTEKALIRYPRIKMGIFFFAQKWKNRSIESF